MRIIAGEYRGRVLASVRGRDVRPATGRVRSTIFNTLQNRLPINGSRVLDLFAGSGSLGFEALSRGARSAVFVDTSIDAIGVLERNAALLGCTDACDIIRDDGLLFLDRSSSTFHLIFADPPYRDERTPDIPNHIFERGLLEKGGFCIIEHTHRTAIGPSAHFRIVLEKAFGSTRVSFITHP